LKTLTEAWGTSLPEHLERVRSLPENTEKNNIDYIKAKLETVKKIRLITATQPKQTSVPKKKPDIGEIEIGGGTVQQQFNYGKKLLGKSISIEAVFKVGQYVDVVAITTGKGFQGPVKRWGVRKLQHKGRKTKRGIATLGPWKPAHVLYSIPRAGQMGFHKRTEYNKRILKLGKSGKEITPKGGFVNYGVVHGDYTMLAGSVPGPKKRLIKLRYPIRSPKLVFEELPQIRSISLMSPQGK
jgi:large subunit ribosomal protein L3